MQNLPPKRRIIDINKDINNNNTNITRLIPQNILPTTILILIP